MLQEHCVDFSPPFTAEELQAPVVGLRDLLFVVHGMCANNRCMCFLHCVQVGGYLPMRRSAALQVSVKVALGPP